MKSTILMISLPLACLAGGYGAGMYLVPAETRVASADPATLTDAAPGQPGDQAALGIPPAPVDPEAGAPAPETAKGYGDAKAAPAAPLLQVGRLTVPVLKTRSITYVVADIALAMPEADLVKQVEQTPETLLRMRDAVLASLTEAATTPAMSGPTIDTEALSARVLGDLRAIGMPVDEVLFPNMFKQDVARQDIPQRSAAAEPAAPEPQIVTH
ncbi:hypothetical protein [Limimaricola hongkongensis]|uniref:Uncharacterized protein n=1 Tax=Limimaricola hongkongensis DSM 17492 TaxID=1122180 RepID=A0A017HCC6_9RHOB|nr:hypothetical protein [Limimaricola hongkongensis]EYD71960.1 hypothetical protein Lokhon_02032 [Limimaricola hongkongensis DSM 17492]